MKLVRFNFLPLSRDIFVMLTFYCYFTVLGDDKNKAFALNRNGKRVTRVNRADLLSNYSWLPIIVRVFNGMCCNYNEIFSQFYKLFLFYFIDGLIELQIEGERNAFLSATNSKSDPVQYIGFRSNGTQTANWRIDCPIRRPTQPHECQEYSTPANETRYMQTWNVHELDDNRRNGDDLQLNVYVRAARNAGILLSSVEPMAMSTHNISAPYYEILLAAGSDNREFELQRNTGRLDRTTEKNVLDANKWVLVEISLKSGTPILFCNDTFGSYNHF